MTHQSFKAFEISATDEEEFRWLLSKCSRTCSRLFLIASKFGLSVLGHDRHSLLAIVVKWSKSAVTGSLPNASQTFLVDGRQVGAAISSLSGAKTMRLSFLDDHIEFVGTQEVDITFNVGAVRTKPDLRITTSHSKSVRLPTSALL